MNHGSRSTGSDDESEPDTTAAVRRWTRLVRHALRVRRLQRIWGLLGGFLRGFPATLRERLQLVYPTGHP